MRYWEIHLQTAVFTPADTAMIHFNQVSKQFTEQPVFSDISFFLPKASYTCVYGDAGSGKTTLLNMMAGEVIPEHGTVTVNDIELNTLPADRLPYVRRQIGRVESQPLLLENRSTTANVSIPLEIIGFDRAAIRERTTAVLEQLGLAVIADVPVRRLSTDQQWLIACARAAVHRPAVLLIDEPEVTVSNATLTRQQELMERLIVDGVTVVVVTEQLPTQPLPIKVGTLQLTTGKALYDEHTLATGSHQQL